MTLIRNEVNRLADDLKRLADFLPAGSQEGRDTLSIAQKLLTIRRQRERIWLGGLFSEPAWDMMLDLYVAWMTRTQVSVSSLCIASAAPTTTALRYIAALEREGIVERSSDEADRRRQFIELSAKARTEMNTLLSTLV
jgi:hypothetical protein